MFNLISQREVNKIFYGPRSQKYRGMGGGALVKVKFRTKVTQMV